MYEIKNKFGIEKIRRKTGFAYTHDNNIINTLVADVAYASGANSPLRGINILLYNIILCRVLVIDRLWYK